MSKSEEQQGLEYLDDLTGLHNRRYFKERLLAEKREADQKGSSFALMMIDLDNFKPINDIHGHLTGDRVLSQVGRILKESIRSTDTLCRYAGDEFIAILPEIEEKDIIRIAQRIRDRLAKTEWIDDKGEPLEPITCSTGYAFYSDAGRDLNGLIDWADQALYAVKHRGGDGFCGEKELAKKPSGRPLLSTPSMVGRDTELKKLKTILEDVREHGGTLVEITGEAGIGKSRLAREFGLFVERRRGTRLVGGCHEETKNIPYYPFREALSKFFEERRGESISLLRSLPEYSQRELARIVPNLREHRAKGMERAVDPYRLFESARLFLEGVGTRAPLPLLLIMEDIQWADAASLELCQYLARSLTNAPVLICVTYRTEERSRELSRFRGSLRKQELSVEVPLGPLSSKDTTTMARLIFPGKKISKQIKDSLYEKTEGNPFFIEEVLRLIGDEGIEQAQIKGFEIPESVSALLERRIDSLDQEMIEILSLSALIGEEFEFEVLCQALERPEPEVLTAMEEATRAHILRESLEGPDDTYRFMHSMMADVLSSRVGKARRRMWHGRVGDALVEVYKDRLAQLNGRLTYHFEQAEEWQKAVTHAIRSAEQAKSAYANQEAINLYLKIRKILPKLDNTGDEEAIQVAEGLGDIYQLTGAYGKALEEYKLVEETALGRKDRKREADALSKMSRVYQLKGDYDEVMKYAEKSHRIRKEIGDAHGVADSLHAMGNVHWSKGDYIKADKYYEEALAKRRELGDALGAASSLHNIGNIRTEQGEYGEALKRYGESLALRKEAGDTRGAASSLNSLGNVNANRGDYSAALGFYEDALTLRKEIGDIRGTALTLNNIGTVHADTGEYEKALDCYQGALKIQREIGSRREVALILSNIGIIHSNRGEFDDALMCYEDSLNIRKELGDKQGAAFNLHNIAIVHENHGNYSEALKRHSQALKIRKEIGDKNGIALSMHSMGVIHTSLGAYAKAAKLLDDALIIQREVGDRRRIASSLLSIGTLQANQGEYDRALNSYQQALEIQTDIGHKWGRAFTMQEIGSLYQHLHYMDGAKDLHEKSMTLMDELGLKAEKAGLMARMGVDYHLDGDNREAIRLLNEALVMARQLGSKEEEPTILEGLASVWQSVGNDLEARHFCERLNTIAAERGLKSHLAGAKRMKGEMLLGEALSSQLSPLSLQKAEGELKEAVKIAKGIGALPILWQAHASLWELYEKKGDDKKASKQLSKAKEVIDQIASNISDSKLTESFLSSKPVTRVLAANRE